MGCDWECQDCERGRNQLGTMIACESLSFCFELAAPMNHLPIDDADLARRVEELITYSNNRYRITVQVANRAKRRRYDDSDEVDDSLLKPVKRAVLEMSDELVEPEIIGD